MGHVLKSLGVVAVLGATAACTSRGLPVVSELPSDHPHLYAHSKNAGDHHVRPVVDRRRGIVGIEVMDRYERPVRLPHVEYVGAELLLPDGRTRSVRLFADEWWEEHEGPQTYACASRFSRRVAWTTGPYDVRLRVRVPLERRMYELTFPLHAPHALAMHSGL